MSNNIIIRETGQPQEIKVRVTELNRGPQGPAGEKGEDGAIQYTAGSGISIEQNEISADIKWGDITGSLDNQTDLDTALGNKADATTVGDLDNLTTTAKTNLVDAVNEVDSHADTAQSTVDALAEYLNINSFTEYKATQWTVTSGGGTLPYPDQAITVARNTAGTLCKIYGAIQISITPSLTPTKIKLNTDTGLRPTSNLTITGCGISEGSNGVANLTIFINTDGTIELQTSSHSAVMGLRPIACVIFVKDFGDQPE